jgi:hypothetical protein
MKKILWFAAGIGLGMFASKQLAENPAAQNLVSGARDRAKDFGAAVSDGFREREAELAREEASSKTPAAKRKSQPSSKTDA